MRYDPCKIPIKKITILGIAQIRLKVEYSHVNGTSFSILSNWLPMSSEL